MTIYSLSRHRKNGHIPRAVFDILRREREMEGIDLERLRQQVGDTCLFGLSKRRAELEAVMARAIAADQGFLAVAAGREAREHDLAIARMTGEMAPAVHKHMHAIVSGEWQAIRSAILRRARERPELRAEFVALLEEIEGERPHLDGIPLEGPLIEARANGGA